MPLFSMLCLVRYNIKERVERMGTVEERLADSSRRRGRVLEKEQVIFIYILQVLKLFIW